MAKEHIRTWRVGEVEIIRIVEVNAHTDPLSVLLSEGSPELMKRYSWLFPEYATPEGDMRISFQCFVLKTPTQRIMIDTCIGNDRKRVYDIFTNMHTSFMEDLASVDCAPDRIDIVLCSHLHFDHVGWNTYRVDGKWVPTFPNARYLFSQTEWDQWKDMPRDGNIEAEHLVDSIDPVMKAGLVDLIETDHRISDEIWLEPTPGHTPGHVSVRISSEGEQAVITGDLLHHPVQFAVPDMKANFDMDPETGCRTRRAFVERYQDRKALVIGSHFCEPTAGWILRDADAWRFESKKD